VEVSGAADFAIKKDAEDASCLGQTVQKFAACDATNPAGLDRSRVGVLARQSSKKQ
jgi:hypothetical protein